MLTDLYVANRFWYCVEMRLFKIIVRVLVSKIYKSYSESSLWWAFNKTSTEKKILYTKNCSYKLPNNGVTAVIETLVILGISFCVPSMCTQHCFDTFCQLLITVEVVWSLTFLQVAVALGCREDGQISQLKCSSSAWVRTSICIHILPWRSSTLDVSIPCLLFWMALYIFKCFAIQNMVELSTFL
jgi:hypothetical protein